MSDDLVKQLKARRQNVYDCQSQGPEWYEDELCQKAATTIIALLDERDALREQVNALRDVMGTMCAKAIVLESYAENVTGFPMQQRLMGIAKDIDESARSAYEATEPKE